MPDRDNPATFLAVSARRATASPTIRAAAGGLLVALAMLGVLAASTRGEAGGPAVAVVSNVEPGAELGPEHIRVVTLASPPPRVHTEPADVVGLKAQVRLHPGDLVHEAMVQPDPPDDARYRVTIEVAGGTPLTSGERVDVLVTWGDAGTEVLVRGARVASLDSTDGLLRGSTVQRVEIGLADGSVVPALVHGSIRGRITLVRTSERNGPYRAGTVFRPAPDAESGYRP